MEHLEQSGLRDLPTPGSSHRHLESRAHISLAPPQSSSDTLARRHRAYDIQTWSQRHSATDTSHSDLNYNIRESWCLGVRKVWQHVSRPSVLSFSPLCLCRFLCQVLASINWSPTTMKFYESQSVLTPQTTWDTDVIQQKRATCWKLLHIR